MQIGKNNALHPIKAISPPSIEVTSFVFSYINGISGRINVGIAIALWINNNARSTFSFLSIAIAIKKVATQRKKYASKSIAKNAVPGGDCATIVNCSTDKLASLTTDI